MKRVYVLGATLLFTGTAGIAFADSADRSVITTREMPASPDRVLQAFLADSDLHSWWKTTRTLVEPVKGGVWSIAWDDWGGQKTHHSWTGVIRELSANRVIVGPMVMIEPGMPLLGPMTLEIFVEPADNAGASVTVTHSGYGYGDHWDEMYELVVDGWDHVLGDMQAWFQETY